MQNMEGEQRTAPLLTTQELSGWLRVKESTIRKWVCYDRIPYLKVGRLVVFQREDIELWLMRSNPKREKWALPSSFDSLRSLRTTLSVVEGSKLDGKFEKRYNVPVMARYPSGLRERSAKPRFAGSNPARASTLTCQPTSREN